MLDRALPDPPPGVVHGFTTRLGGVSSGPLASLNLALREGQDGPGLTENWRRVLRALGGDFPLESLALVDQVHGATVLHVDRGGGPLATVGQADALICTRPGVVLGIRTADCAPILLATEGGIGAVHAGWRGVAAQIVPDTVHRLACITGRPPSTIRAAVGPHISAPAYPVGPEVADGLEAAGIPRSVFLRDGHTVDLRAAVVHQLTGAGVRLIGHVHRCTASDPHLFSHRRDGPRTGRLGAVIGWIG